jgi:mRNA degradation ribonuclease J1/J2
MRSEQIVPAKRGFVDTERARAAFEGGVRIVRDREPQSGDTIGERLRILMHQAPILNNPKISVTGLFEEDSAYYSAAARASRSMTEPGAPR